MICEPDTALEDTSGIDGTGNRDASSLLAKSRHDLLPPDESHVLKRDPVSVRQKYLSPGMILTHIDGKAVPNTYDGALEALHASSRTSELLFAPASYISRLNTAEKLAQKLTDSSRAVTDAVTSAKTARLNYNEAVTMHETTMESIFRQFRRVESGRVCGMRQAMLQVIDLGIQQWIEKCQNANLVASKSVIGIDSVLDLKVKFNARVNAYHARDGTVGTDSTTLQVQS